MKPTATQLRVRELERTPDLVELAGAARDAGHEVILIERPMPDAVSVAGIGKAFEIVGSNTGVTLEDAAGHIVDEEPGPDVVQAAARMWRRLRHTLQGAVALGGFAYRPDRQPSGPWAGFPSLLLRVPALTVTRVRGRTYITCATDDAEELLDVLPSVTRPPLARTLDVSPVRNPVAWAAAIDS